MSEQANPSPFLNSGKKMPHNTDAEIAVLGAILLDPRNCLDTAAGKLSYEESFYTPAHQAIFNTLVKMGNEKTRKAIDLVTLTDALKKESLLEDVGGIAYLNRIINGVPTAANIEQYVEIVQQQSVLRRLIRTCHEIMDRCYTPGDDIKDLLDKVESEVLSVTDLQSDDTTVACGDIIMDAINYIEKLHNQDHATLGIQTGYPDLDELLTGLRPGEMTVLAARPSIGKTAFALNMASNMALNDPPIAVGFFSLEMGADMLVLRLLTSHAKLNLGNIRDGALSQGRWQDIMTAGQELRTAPIYIDDTGGIDILELRAKARRMKRDHNIQIIIIDYLQLLKASGGNANSSRENEVSRISGAIKSLAKELKIPIVVLAQLNRQAEATGQRPKLSNLRESGAIEQDADVVAILHRDRQVDADPHNKLDALEAELIIAKHRNGPTGIVNLMFIPSYTRFVTRSPIPDADVPHV